METDVLNENPQFGTALELIRKNEFLKSTKITDDDVSHAIKMVMMKLSHQLNKLSENRYNEDYYSDEERVLVAAYASYDLFVEKVEFQASSKAEEGEEVESDFAVKKVKTGPTEVEFDTKVSGNKFELTKEEIEGRLKKKVCEAAKVLKIVIPDLCPKRKRRTNIGAYYG